MDETVDPFSVIGNSGKFSPGPVPLFSNCPLTSFKLVVFEQVRNCGFQDVGLQIKAVGTL
jgi:hypothetical protein